jgi:transcriptional regulator with XRE-family HTH domain
MMDSMGVHCIPTFGIFNAHIRESGIGTVSGMRPRDVLAENLRKLMKAREDLSRFPDITSASRGELTNGTLDRIRRAEVALTIDKLASLAEVFDLEPWQLLVENLNPKALPRLADSSLLSQIKAMVESAKAENAEDSPSPTDEQPLQPSGRDRQVPIGPALTEVLGEDKNARRRTASASKPKGRRRS